MELIGISELPLHDGHVPPWLFKRMVKLTQLILTIMVDYWGVKEVVKRFSNPIFFQAFNNLIGMDWDSSGSTTITTAVLREALSQVDIGIKVVGGKGKMALEIPKQLDELAKKFNIDAEYMKLVSRLVAKVDNVALQDGYQLYHQAIVVGEDGSWSIIQQGMNVSKKLARRYHWWMNTTFINNPHSGILGFKEDFALNLVSSRSESARKTIIDIVNQDVNKVIRDFYRVKQIVKGLSNRKITSYLGLNLKDDYDVNIEVLSKLKDLLLKLNLDDKILMKLKGK